MIVVDSISLRLPITQLPISDGGRGGGGLEGGGEAEVAEGGRVGRGRVVRAAGGGGGGGARQVLGSVEFFVAFADEGGGFAALQRTKTSTALSFIVKMHNQSFL